MMLTQDEVRALLRRAGLRGKPRQLTIGSAIALCEAPSYTDPPLSDFDLVGDVELADDVWGYSYSGFQIRSLRADAGTGRIRDAERLDDPEFAARSAVAIYRQSGWWPWTTFRNGNFKAYAQNIPEFQPPPGSYIVVGGDSLSKIGERLGVSWQDIARLNGLHDPYLLHIGDILILP